MAELEELLRSIYEGQMEWRIVSEVQILVPGWETVGSKTRKEMERRVGRVFSAGKGFITEGRRDTSGQMEWQIQPCEDGKGKGRPLRVVCLDGELFYSWEGKRFGKLERTLGEMAGFRFLGISFMETELLFPFLVNQAQEKDTTNCSVGADELAGNLVVQDALRRAGKGMLPEAKISLFPDREGAKAEVGLRLGAHVGKAVEKSLHSSEQVETVTAKLGPLDQMFSGSSSHSSFSWRFRGVRGVTQPKSVCLPTEKVPQQLLGLSK